jgi:hypothetical protein
MDLKKRIEKINPYFYGMNMSIEDNVVYVQTKFPDNWTISDFLEESFNVKGVFNAKKQTHIFFTEMDNGFDKVFDAIDYTIQMNLNALERLELFKKKVEELKTLFDEEDIDKLKKLEFVIKKTKRSTNKDKLVSQYVAPIDETLEARNGNMEKEVNV